MKAELKKRVMTSIILFIAAIFCIMIHQIVFLFVISVVLYICFQEWCTINVQYFREANLSKFWDYFYIKVLGLTYLAIVWFSAFSLRGFSFENGIFFIIILCICICSDIGGYIFGRAIGGKKLTKISPNKTVSGSIGSFLFSLFPIVIVMVLGSEEDFVKETIFFCLLISLVCQLGDLIISYFKRLAKVKDTGDILPGHGGMLDRIDGIIFALPTLLIVNYVL